MGLGLGLQELNTPGSFPSDGMYLTGTDGWPGARGGHSCWLHPPELSDSSLPRCDPLPVTASAQRGFLL